MNRLKQKCQNSVTTSPQNTSSDVKIMWNTFKTSSFSIMEEYVPSKTTSSRFNRPWINRREKRRSGGKKLAFRKAKQSHNQDDIDRYICLQKTMHIECKWHQNNCVKDIIDSESNLKKMYSYINRKTCDSRGVTLLKKWHCLQ